MAARGRRVSRPRQRVPPPPSHTNPPAAYKAAHGCPATPAERVYPEGVRRGGSGTGTGATGHPLEAGGWGTAARPPLPSPPHSPPRPAGHGGAGPPAPPRPWGRSPSPRGDRDAREGTQLDLHAARPRAPRGGCNRRANPHQRTRTTHGPGLGAARGNEPEQYGARAPHDLSAANDARIVAPRKRAEGRTEQERPPGPPAPRPPLRGGDSLAAPPPRQAGPPAAGRTRRLGLPHNPDRTRTLGGMRRRRKGDGAEGRRPPPPEKGVGEQRRDPPPVPPPLPPTRKPRGRWPPTPPRRWG